MRNSNVLSLAIIILIVGGTLFFMYHSPNLSAIPEEGNITLTGTVSCLPHVHSSGPQTQECAYGLYDQQHGYYYAVEDDPASGTHLAQFQTGTQVTVSGSFKEGAGATYDTIGTITNALIVPVQTPHSTSTMQASSSSSSTSMQTTSDGVIGITIPSQYAFAAAPQPVLVHPVIPPCSEGFDYCVYYDGSAYAHTNFLSAGIAIKHVPKLRNKSDCLNTPPDGYENLALHATSSGNGYTIGVFTSLENGAAGSSSTGEEYRLFTADTCYAMTLRVGVSDVEASTSSSTNAMFTQQDRSDLMALLRNILSAFVITATGQHLMLPETS